MQLNILTDRDLNMRILSREAAGFFSLSLHLFTMGTLHATSEAWADQGFSFGFF